MILKKLLTYFVLFNFFLSNSIGVIIVYNQIKNYHKRTIYEQIRSNNFNQVIEILSFSKVDLQKKLIKLEFIEEHEFRFNGKLYDIISKWETEDSIFYKCINDIKEKELEEIFVSYIVNNSHRQDLPLPIKQLLASIQMEYFLLNKFLNQPLLNFLYFSFTSVDNPFDLCLIIPDPPPRFVN
ncbi:MAG: hypothetical protein ACPL25_10405 [Ignavibacteria bacterium]